MICPACRKPLSSARSKRIGYGPTCFRREKRMPFLFPEEEITIKADVILIRGDDGLLRGLSGRPR